MRSCANCRPYWRPGPACAPSAAPGSTPTREPRPNEVLLVGPVGEEEIGEGVVARGQARVDPAMAGCGDAADVECARAVRGGGVHVRARGQEHADDLDGVARS